MAEETKTRSRNRRRPKQRSNGGYVHRSPAVNITVYDLGGRPMPDADAAQIVNSIFDVAMEKGYVINFTRT